jgi:hypothetical protein
VVSKYTSTGASSITKSNTTPADMADMTLTFTPKNATVILHFSASGNYTGTSASGNIGYFDVLVNGVKVTGTKCIVGEFDDYGDASLIWGTAMTYPLNLTVGSPVTVKIQWSYNGSGTLTNDPTGGTNHHRDIVILDL